MSSSQDVLMDEHALIFQVVYLKPLRDLFYSALLENNGGIPWFLTNMAYLKI